MIITPHCDIFLNQLILDYFYKDNINIGLENAIKINNVDLVNYYINKGANNVKYNIFKYIIDNNYVEICLIIINKIKISGDIFDDVITYSFSIGNLYICEILIKKTFKLNQAAYVDYITLFENSLKYHYFDFAMFILKKYADNEFEIIRLLIISATEGHRDLCEEIIKKKNKNQISELTYRLCLENSIRKGHIELCKFFIHKGAKVTWETFYVSAQTGHVDIFEYLISTEGKYPSIRTINFPIRFKNKDMVKLCIDNYQKYNVKNNEYMIKQLDYAKRVSTDQIVNLLQNYIYNN